MDAPEGAKETPTRQESRRILEAAGAKEWTDPEGAKEKCEGQKKGPLRFTHQLLSALIVAVKRRVIEIVKDDLNAV